jgi:uncharacterized protein
MAAINLDEIVAIDIHTHVHASIHGGGANAERMKAMREYFRADEQMMSDVPGMAAYYRERKMMAVAFTVDNYTVSGGDPSPSNEEVAELAADNADAIIPFASVDPGRGKAAVRMARRLIEQHHVKGFKFHPNTQEFFPTIRRRTRCTRSSKSTACRRCSTAATPVSAPASAAVAASD